MKVSRMIKQLQKMNPNAEVKMHLRGGEPVLFVLAVKGDEKEVWLESESDCDLGEELQVRFDTLKEEQLDQVEFFTDLLETGIDVGTVRKYMGDDTANYMQDIITLKEKGFN